MVSSTRRWVTPDSRWRTWSHRCSPETHTRSTPNLPALEPYKPSGYVCMLPALFCCSCVLFAIIVALLFLDMKWGEAGIDTGPWCLVLFCRMVTFCCMFWKSVICHVVALAATCEWTVNTLIKLQKYPCYTNTNTITVVQFLQRIETNSL